MGVAMVNCEYGKNALQSQNVLAYVNTLLRIILRGVLQRWDGHALCMHDHLLKLEVLSPDYYFPLPAFSCADWIPTLATRRGKL